MSSGVSPKEFDRGDGGPTPAEIPISTWVSWRGGSLNSSADRLSYLGQCL
jgi:hypothetical protein